MHKKIFLILGIVFLGVGLLHGAIGAAIWGLTSGTRRQVMADAVPVTATIVEITPQRASGSNSNRVYIEYEADGTVVRAPLSWWSTSMYVGRHMDIYVSRQNPQDFVMARDMLLIPVYVLGGIGAIFSILGASFLFAHKRRRRRHRWLLDFGMPVWANVLGAQDNWNIQVNGRPATSLVAAYNNMEFVSGPIDNNDLASIGEHVKVLLDPDNYNRYTFDFKNESYLEPLEPPKPLQRQQ